MKETGKSHAPVLLAILTRVHDYACLTSFENIMESAKFCRELILAHSARRPPFSIEVFTPEQAALADSFMMDNYMRHFKLYKYVFTPRIVMDLAFQYPNEPECEVVDNNGEFSTILKSIRQ